MSSVLDYFTSGMKDTYNETVDYWSKDGSIKDGLDTVIWSAQNTDVVAQATKKGINNSVNELGTAVKEDTFKLVALAVLAITVYHFIFKGGLKKWI